MAYLIKSSVMDALHEDEQMTIMCYEDKKSKDLIQFCYESMEREINKLPQYRPETVTDADERQEPKKPIMYKGSNIADCPNYGAVVRGIHEPFGDWCSKCGQRLDWSVEDD